MDCLEVKKILHAYIDNDIERGMEKIVKVHLSSCDACREEYDNLMKYEGEMSSLKQVKPPEDFLQQIHKRMEKPSYARQIAQKLFFPLNIKLPLEAAGVLATVVIAVLIFNPTGSMKQTIHSEKDMAEMADAVEEETGAGAPLMRPAAEGEMQRAKVGSSVKFAAKKLQPVVSDRKEVLPGKVSKAKKKTKLDFDDSMETYEIALLLNTNVPVLPPSEAGSAQMGMSAPESSISYDEEKASKDADVRDLNKRESPDAEEDKKAEEKNEYRAASKSRKAAPVPARIGVEGHLSREQADSLKEIQELTKRLGGRITNKRYRSGMRTLEYIELDVPASNYRVFIVELKRFGTFQRKAPKSPLKNRKRQQLRIQLISR